MQRTSPSGLAKGRDKMASSINAKHSVFKAHFPGDPVVPGFMPLSDYLANFPAGNANHLSIDSLIFRKMIKPDVDFIFERNHSGNILCCNSENLFFSFRLTVSKAELSGHTEAFVAKGAEHSVIPLRHPDYWFLPEKIQADSSFTCASCVIDTKLAIERSPWIETCAGGVFLLLVEALGNLALVVNATELERAVAAESRFVFVRFSKIRVSTSLMSELDKFMLSTRVTRKGNLLTWEGNVINGDGTLLLDIQGAVSMKTHSLQGNVHA
ncbi:hypothetical protein [Xenorhabdus griffiniae]|uniref:ApeI dehydratase-like domain-containing protein n=1 Tax=Xenorhabdus griffiniae TaxID=351672 RepID=A0ABY9XJ72_9GAMM|nr:hypothetical protein [Xenorhabdus griffiniae]MBD1228691.1 hypothetical protein [Xenorhabdus griffiniae]MBE8588311.1 hypothetical protein [Xenorhabdus griffiniae]WMV72994.1 hypothetical protein QL128_02760 [Xenorhabdus griffiniae]WNH02673.1 hypothetical protein QL112_002765 [Xenorhabdus griffiniae]